jgi:CelD/BcsL family acetyltransferase involved in cellulose biosynthesis
MNGALVECFRSLDLPAGEWEQWTRIQQETADASIYQSALWVREWFPVYGDGWSPLILKVTDPAGGRVLGYAPLMAGRGNFLKRVVPDWRELRLIGDREPANSDFGGFVCREEHRAEFLGEVLSHLLRRARPTWDVLRLANLADGQHEAVRRALDALGLDHRVGAERENEAPYLRLPGSQAQYHDGQDGRFRRNLKRRLQRLGEECPVRFETVRDPGSWARCREAVRSLHADWCQARMRRKPDAVFLDFLDRICGRLSEAGALRLHLLWAGDRLAAFTLGFVQGRRFFGYQKAHRDDLGKFSPDSLLMNRMVESGIAEGLERIEMGQGSEEYKRHWASHQRPLWDVTLSNTTLRGRIQMAANRCRRRRRAVGEPA